MNEKFDKVLLKTRWYIESAKYASTMLIAIIIISISIIIANTIKLNGINPNIHFSENIKISLKENKHYLIITSILTGIKILMYIFILLSSYKLKRINKNQDYIKPIKQVITYSYICIFLFSFIFSWIISLKIKNIIKKENLKPVVQD